MLGFVSTLPSITRKSYFRHPPRRNTCLSRQPQLSCLASQKPIQDDDSLHDFVSDTTHVVLDSRDIPDVLSRLQTSEDHPDQFFNDFLQHAEHHVDGTSPQTSSTSSTSEPAPHVTDYFNPEFLPYLPRWARDAFQADDTISLTSTEPLPHRRRLHDIAEKPAGIADCLLSDVAADYTVPVEFIIDAVLALGVHPPVAVHDSVKNTLNDTQIAKLSGMLSTFDALDLADRYSDRCVKEMADDYDLHLNTVMRICEEEGFHMCSGSATRLSLIQEDRVLDILLKGAPTGEPYPSPLEGLV